MCARGECLAIVIPAHQVGRDRESLEVFGVERCVTISGVQEAIRFGPRPLLERLPPTLQCREVRHIARFETVDRWGRPVSTTLSRAGRFGCEPEQRRHQRDKLTSAGFQRSANLAAITGIWLRAQQRVERAFLWRSA